MYAWHPPFYLNFNQAAPHAAMFYDVQFNTKGRIECVGKQNRQTEPKSRAYRMAPVDIPLFGVSACLGAGNRQIIPRMIQQASATLCRLMAYDAGIAAARSGS